MAWLQNGRPFKMFLKVWRSASERIDGDFGRKDSGICFSTETSSHTNPEA
jgi:hypothetical protein